MIAGEMRPGQVSVRAGCMGLRCWFPLTHERHKKDSQTAAGGFFIELKCLQMTLKAHTEDFACTAHVCMRIWGPEIGIWSLLQRHFSSQISPKVATDGSNLQLGTRFILR